MNAHWPVNRPIVVQILCPIPKCFDADVRLLRKLNRRGLAHISYFGFIWGKYVNRFHDIFPARDHDHPRANWNKLDMVAELKGTGGIEGVSHDNRNIVINRLASRWGLMDTSPTPELTTSP